MIITQKAIDQLTTKAKNRIALANNCSIYTVERWIKDNEKDIHNTDLTKAVSVQIIKEETGLDDSEILVEADKVKAA